MSEFDRPADDPSTQETPPLIVYCRPWCGDCMRAKRWLESENIPYVEFDVDEDAEARARAEGHNFGRLHTPTFECGDDVCVDFHPEIVKRMVGK